MKNKDKYDLRTLKFTFAYNSYFDEVNTCVMIEDKQVAQFKGKGKGFNSKKIIMNWLEMECEEND